jgi:hypothetical protein
MERAFEAAAAHAVSAVQLARSGAVDPQSSAWVGGTRNASFVHAVGTVYEIFWRPKSVQY